MHFSHTTWIDRLILVMSLFVCQTTFASSDALKFNKRMIELLPPGSALEWLKTAKERGNLGMEGGFYDFAEGICSGLANGADRKTILEESYYHFFGKELSDVIYEAALDTLCPEFRR